MKYSLIQSVLFQMENFHMNYFKKGEVLEIY